MHQISNGQNEEVEKIGSDEISHRQIRHLLSDCADSDQEFWKRGRACQQNTAGEKSSQAGNIGYGIGGSGQKIPGEDDRRGRNEKLYDQLP